MVSDRRLKLDAKRHQATFGGSYQAAVEAVRRTPRKGTPKARPAMAPVSDGSSPDFRDWLTAARKAAQSGDIAKTQYIVNAQLGLNFRAGPDVAGTLLLHSEEFDRTSDSRLPGLVRRLLHSETGSDRPVWKHRVHGTRVFLFSELSDEVLGLVSTYEPATEPEPDGVPEDPRARLILNRLNAMERRTLLAWQMSGVRTWHEAAAEAAGGPQDPRFAEQVRRKVRHLAKTWKAAA